MIPNAWVAYKITKKATSSGKRGPALKAEDDEEIIKQEMLFAIQIFKWTTIIMVIYLLYCLISVPFPQITFGMGQSWDEYSGSQS